MIKWTKFRPSALDITELVLIPRLPSWWACGSSPPWSPEGGEETQPRARRLGANCTGTGSLLHQSQGWWQFSLLGSQTSLSARLCFLGRWETELPLSDRPGTIPRHSTPLQGTGGKWARLPEARKPERLEGCDLCTQRRRGEMCGQTLPLIEGLGWEGKFIQELYDPGQVVGSQFLQWWNRNSDHYVLRFKCIWRF